MSKPAQAIDESMISEITIRPDGRVYVFGLSRELLEVLQAVNPRDPKLRTLVTVGAAIASPTTMSTEHCAPANQPSPSSQGRSP